MLKIRLVAAAARKAGLLNPDIIYVDNYEWITNINDKVDYLFTILGLVLSVDRREIRLSILRDGEWRDEASSMWVQVKEGDGIVGGLYMASVRPGIFDISSYFHIDFYVRTSQEGARN